MVGGGNELIIRNITAAFAAGKQIVLRIPVIPDFNDSLEDAEQFAQLFDQMKVKRVQLLPFHQFGQNKYRLLKRQYTMATYQALHPEDLKAYQAVFLHHDIYCYF